MWLLRINEQTDREERWKKLKPGPKAPSPRSGLSAVKLSERTALFFGGIVDEFASDEILLGSSLNDFYLYDMVDHQWTQLTAQGDAQDLCGRLNAMLARRSDQAAFLFGGIWERGDTSIVLDDLYELFIEKETISVKQLQKVSPELQDCWLRPEEDDSDMSDGSESDSDSESSSDSDEGEEDQHEGVSKYSSLKEMFDDQQEHWMAEARSQTTDDAVTDKQLRQKAFQLAKQAWEDHAALLQIARL